MLYSGILLLRLMRYVVESVPMSRNYRAVNEDLMKFLDFLGNFSISFRGGRRNFKSDQQVYGGDPCAQF